MHILLIHQAFAALNEPGGTRHHEMARYLAQQGHQVTVIASPISYLTGAAGAVKDGSMPDEWEAGVTILRAYTYSALHRSFLHRVVSFFSFMISSFILGLKVRQVNVVWGSSPPIFQAITAWALARLKGVSFIFEVRDLWPAFAVEVGVLRQPALIKASEWLERFLYRRADRLVVNSPGFMEHVRQRGARVVDCVPNGADPRMFDPEASGEDFRLRHGLGDQFVALYAGAHGMSNDLETLLQAAARLRNEKITIVMLGDGKEKPALIEKSRALGLSNVCFLPPMPKIEMSQALAAADACIAILKAIPLYATVYHNKVFDYMAAGRPVILAIDGVIRKVVESNRAGIFVPPGDPAALAEALRRLAAHRDESRQMGIRGRRVVEADFDRAKLAGQMAQILEAAAVAGPTDQISAN